MSLSLLALLNSSIIPPYAPAAVALLLIVYDQISFLFNPPSTGRLIFKVSTYASLTLYTYIRYKTAFSRMQVEVDGFLVKSITKKSEFVTATRLSEIVQPNGTVLLSPRKEESGPVWPPIETLGWTPFSSLPFNQPKPKGAQHFWSKGSASEFHVRSVGYKSSKSKEPSAPPLYECIGVDLVRSNKLITNVAGTCPIFQSPSQAINVPPYWTKDPKWSPSLGVPRIIVINMQLPYSSPSLWAPQSADSDPGFSVVSYYALSPSYVEKLESCPATKLLKRLIEEGKSMKETTALKAIGLVENLDEVGFPEIVSGYNGKPVLVTKSAKLHSLSSEVFEIEFDIRQWSILARKSLHSLQAKLKEARCQFGMLIEGKSDEELPEQLLGCYRIHFIDIHEALNIVI